MEAMIKALLKSYGFEPDTVKAQVNKAVAEFAELKAQLNRIEKMLSDARADAKSDTLHEMTGGVIQ